ncbi:hypothetical protein [Acinetobacter gyllenbergii]|uniref:hypothetical protein n=1 Tax=Acinetobacter gyllenbergii TaxID=134534 RepID=UPI0009D6A30C|nr:hypothetical protein [Acinetobacter gyllenbergii]
MNKEELYNLSKERLYIIYQDLKSSNVGKHILNSIQFFDVIPSESIWDNYISKNENKVIYFDNDLILSEKYRNYTDFEKALDDLKWFSDDNKLFFYFIIRKTLFYLMLFF